MIPDHITPEDLASIRYVAGTCDGPLDRAIGNLIRSLASDIEQWQNVAADIWDDAYWQGNADGRWDDLTPNPYRASETA